MTGVGEGLTDLFAPSALPDNGVVKGSPRFSVENDNGFALVGQAETGDGTEICPVTIDQRRQYPECVLPDFFGVVLDPSRLRVDLPMIERLCILHSTCFVEQDGFGRGGALVHGQNGRHRS